MAGNYRLWSLTKQRFLELQDPDVTDSGTDNPAPKQVKLSGKTGEGDSSKITFRDGQKHEKIQAFYLELQKDGINYGLEVDSSNAVTVKSLGRDNTSNPSVEFIPQLIGNGPFIVLIALKPPWSLGDDKKNCLASSGDGTLSLKAIQHLDQPHPDTLFLKTDV